MTQLFSIPNKHGESRINRIKAGGKTFRKKERFCELHGWSDLFLSGGDDLWQERHGNCKADQSFAGLTVELPAPQIRKDFNKDFNALDLTKPLDPLFLNSLTLDELADLKKTLIKRALAVVIEIEMLKSDPEDHQQIKLGLFNSFHKIGEKKVWVYYCEPRLQDLNIFVCGEWFAQFYEELEQLKAIKTANQETFVDRNKTKLISQLTGA